MKRREFIKLTTLNAGLLIGYGHFGYARNVLQDGRTQRGPVPVSPDNPAIQLLKDRCVNCGRCRGFCSNTTAVYEQVVPSGEDPCVYCGQCTLFCPHKALTEQFHYQEVAQAIANSDKIVIASTAPSIRVALGEMYDLTPGTDVEGKIVGALKQMGVDHVLDATFSADLAVMEEATELLQRLEKGLSDSKPMFTSCCPSWVRFVKLFYPAIQPNLSTAKSPLLMQGALVKTWFAAKQGIDPANIIHIALMPCTAKKSEIWLEGMNSAGVSHGKPEMRDVDIALTCRELAYLLNESTVNFLEAQDAPYSPLMGSGSGAGLIFGNTGGVMEATLRTAYKLLNDKNPPAEFYELRPVRGFDGVRQANVDLGKHKLNVAVVHGLINAKSFIETLQSDQQPFDFVEVMACPGGCIGGGGQPNISDIDAEQLKQQRLNALYQRDISRKIRLSCDNPEIKAIYNDFLGEPLGKKSTELLHIERC